MRSTFIRWGEWNQPKPSPMSIGTLNGHERSASGGTMESNDLTAQVNARKTECKAKKLDHALYNLFWSIENYPAWAKKGSAGLCAAIEQPTGEKTSDSNTITFQNRGKEFSMHLKGTGDYRTLTLCTPRDRKVLSISISSSGDSEWPCDRKDVVAYVPGEWCEHLLEINSAVSNFNTERARESGKLMRDWEATKTKNDFGL